jgi:hypothetical protein
VAVVEALMQPWADVLDAHDLVCDPITTLTVRTPDFSQVTIGFPSLLVAVHFPGEHRR